MLERLQPSIKMTDTQENILDESNKKEKETSENFTTDKTLDEEPEIAFDWKKEIPGVIRSGNINRLEEIMEAKDFDINTTWFQENLLMIAIRAGQTEMAEFLIDNGINYNFTRKVLDYKRATKQIDCYVVGCRQMAYDHRMTDVVNLIDQKNDQLFSFIKLRQRTPRIYVPKKLVSDDNEAAPDNRVEISTKEQMKYQEKKSAKSKRRNMDEFYQKGLNLHRLTPDLILRERRQRQQLFLPLCRNSLRTDVDSSYILSKGQNGVSLSMLTTPVLAGSLAATDLSFHWPVLKENAKNCQRPKTTATMRCWGSNNSSRRVNSIERQFREISCGDLSSKRIWSQVPPKKNMDKHFRLEVPANRQIDENAGCGSNSGSTEGYVT